MVNRYTAKAEAAKTSLFIQVYYHNYKSYFKIPYKMQNKKCL